ncbi:glycosyltransferase family 4 protein [Streptomyces sp. PKU-MA01144]|uniref:glycosyltransferase family 4 protein n=1 Tax=Streptomyces TaxID=1883 RepID=UPI00147BBE4C|nr:MULTISPECIES: glycosyltransferase family 4 protein [Streptomyces]MCY0981282.1 glycosyltransferase family 4 protein [Streptomyces tirandamycinicus]NNJ07247.1 glycosyltransferase family 4 protein [Streptomyces sp. PKU-MA01144]
MDDTMIEAPLLHQGIPPRSPAAYRVALVHSFYSSRRPSGENAAVLDQAEALRGAGHDVTLVAAHTDTLETERGYALRAAVQVATGRGRSPLAQLRRLGPDVVHVHNLFPNFATDWLNRWPGALVATLHNYRPACASATLFREGTMCTACPDGDRWAGLRHGCYRGGRSATLPLAWAGRRGAAAHPLLRRAHRLVTLSERSRDLYLRFGVPPEKLALVPNFVHAGSPACPEDSTTVTPETAARWVYVGRLSEEKGILPLLRSWPEGEPLDVIGSGPLEPACRHSATGTVRLLGTLSRQEIAARLPRYTGLVFPSICPEGAPLVCQEALAAGVPVLALTGSAAADSVRRDGTGAVYGDAGDLPQALATARERFPALREHCRRMHAERYSARSWTAGIQAVYAQAMAQAAGRPAAPLEPAC